MTPYFFNKYREASRPMDASEFREIQIWMELGNAEMADLLRRKLSIVEAYRMDGKSHRPIPAMVAGFLRLAREDMEERKNRSKLVRNSFLKKHPDRKPNKHKAQAKPIKRRRRKTAMLTQEEKSLRIRAYNRHYKRWQRGDRKAMNEFYKKWGRQPMGPRPRTLKSEEN